MVVSATAAVATLFIAWEFMLSAVPPDAGLLDTLHLIRGISSALITGAVVLLVGQRLHRRETQDLTQQAEGSAALLSEVVNTTPAGLIVLDQHLKIVDANPTARRVHQKPLIGDFCTDVLGGCAHSCVACPARTAFSAGTAQLDSHEHKDPRTGEILSVDFHPIKLPNGEPATLVVERVVTESKKLQARLIHQEKMAAFGLLAAGIAHDMGNPLSAINMHLELIESDYLPTDTRESLDTVRGEVRRLRRILRELVDFARRRRDDEAMVSVNSVLEDGLRLLRHDPRMRGVTVDVQTDAEIPPVLMIEDHLVQVVVNLMINALDAMPDGGRLQVSTTNDGSDVILRIADSGQGMRPEVLQKCFEPLYTTKAHGKGTGLGLSICRDIVRTAGGDVELHSVAGEGTTASLRVPGVDILLEQEAA